MNYSDTHLTIKHPQRKGCGKSSMTVKVVDEKYSDEENNDVINEAIKQLEHMQSLLMPPRWSFDERWEITPNHDKCSRRIIYIKELRGCVGLPIRLAKDMIDHFFFTGESDPAAAALKFCNANQNAIGRIVSSNMTPPEMTDAFAKLVSE